MENTAEIQEPEMAITLHDESQEDFLAAYDEVALRKKAAEEAAKPYLEAIAELDEMYATILALSGS